MRLLQLGSVHQKCSPLGHVVLPETKNQQSQGAPRRTYFSQAVRLMGPPGQFFAAGLPAQGTTPDLSGWKQTFISVSVSQESASCLPIWFWLRVSYNQDAEKGHISRCGGELTSSRLALMGVGRFQVPVHRATSPRGSWIPSESRRGFPRWKSHSFIN